MDMATRIYIECGYRSCELYVHHIPRIGETITYHDDSTYFTGTVTKVRYDMSDRGVSSIRLTVDSE